MKKRMALSSLLAISLAFSGTAMAKTTFKDITGHWAQSTIEWGAGQNFVHGYPDGTFKPNRNVVEDEFLALLIGSYHPVGFTVAKGTHHWADSYYDFAAKMNYPVSDAREARVSREHVAEIVAATQGMNYKGAEAIKFLLVNGLANGKVAGGAPTVDNFKGGDTLTRAEAVRFIKNVLDNGVKDAMPAPAQPSDTKELDKQYNDLVKKTFPLGDPMENLEKAKNSIALHPEAGITQENINKWSDVCYELGKKSGMVNGKFRVYLPQGIPDEHYVSVSFENGKSLDFSFGKPKGKDIPEYLEFDVEKSKEIGFGVYIQAVVKGTPLTYSSDGWNSNTNVLYVTTRAIERDVKPLQ